MSSLRFGITLGICFIVFSAGCYYYSSKKYEKSYFWILVAIYDILMTMAVILYKMLEKI